MGFEKYTHLLTIRKAEPHYCQIIDISGGNDNQKQAYFSFLLMRGWSVHLIAPDFDIAAYVCECDEKGINEDEMVKHILKNAEISMSVK